MLTPECAVTTTNADVALAVVSCSVEAARYYVEAATSVSHALSSAALGALASPGTKASERSAHPSPARIEQRPPSKAEGYTA